MGTHAFSAANSHPHHQPPNPNLILLSRSCQVPLAKAYDIYSQATMATSGTVRTVRGPSMSATPGKVQVVGITSVKGEKVGLFGGWGSGFADLWADFMYVCICSCGTTWYSFEPCSVGSRVGWRLFSSSLKVTVFNQTSIAPHSKRMYVCMCGVRSVR